jgi:hypothetical protein
MTRLCTAACVVLWISGCAHTAPQLYSDTLPTIDAPTLTEHEHTADDCPDARGVDPGETVGCGGVLMPTARALGLLQSEDVLVPWYRDRLAIERRYRLQDRSHGQESLTATWERAVAAERREDLLRLAVPVVAVLCIVAGAAVGIAADDLAEVGP